MTTYLVQISDRLITPKNPMRDFYTRMAPRIPGYYISDHYMELPLWEAQAYGYSDQGRGVNVHNLAGDDLYDAMAFLASQLRPGDQIVMSVMEANWPTVQQVMLGMPEGVGFCLGGYIGRDRIHRWWDGQPRMSKKPVEWHDSLATLAGAIGSWDCTRPPNWSPWRGVQCIPRLYLSHGCPYNCTFCTVQPKGRTEDRITADVHRDAECWEPLKFTRVYIGDPTFDAPNSGHLVHLHRAIQEYNPDFGGFIVQTSPKLMAAPGWVQRCITPYRVRLIELGVESCHGPALRQWRKPHTEGDIEDSLRYARDIGVPVVPYVLLGGLDDRPLETADRLIPWIEKGVIPWVNVNWLTPYAKSDGTPTPGFRQPSDGDENNPFKSWLTEGKRAVHLKALDRLVSACEEASTKWPR